MISEQLESAPIDVDQEQLGARLTKNVPETALDAEMAEHHDKHDSVGRGSGDCRTSEACRAPSTDTIPVH